MTNRRNARKMRNLKDVIKYDVEKVFINLNEFAEYVEIDGVILQAQVQYRSEKAAGLKMRMFEAVRGELMQPLHGDYVQMFFRTADYCAKMERLPFQNEYCHVNKKKYKVISCKDEMGITRLILSDYRQEQLRQTPFQRMELGGLDD